MMISPLIVSLPLELVLFVRVDVWALISRGVAASFR
jgi:flagellar biosynthesis protein FliP